MKKTKFTFSEMLPVAAKLELKDPITLEPLGVHVEMVGPESAEFRAIFKQLVKLRGEMSEEELKDPDLADKSENELLAACTLGWDEAYFEKKFSKEAMVEILNNPGAKWLKDQLNAFVVDRTNFFRKRG